MHMSTCIQHMHILVRTVLSALQILTYFSNKVLCNYFQGHNNNNKNYIYIYVNTLINLLYTRG